MLVFKKFKLKNLTAKPKILKIGFQAGVALLLTLSILSMVMFILARRVEDNSVALKLEQNQIGSFKLKRLEYSILRGFVEAINTFGPNLLTYSFAQLEGFGGLAPLLPDDPDILIGKVSIKALDHLFYLNRDTYNFTNQYTLDQIQIVRNALAGFSKRNMNKDYNPLAVVNFLGELNDFVDKDSDLTQNNFLVGREDYSPIVPNFLIKNAKLDSINELKLLPSFYALNALLPEQSVFDLPFRIFEHKDASKQCDIGPLNLNMLPPDKEKSKAILLEFMELALNISDSNCSYTVLYRNRARLSDMVSDYLDKKELPPYSSPLSGDSEWDQQVNLLGEQQAKTSLDGFFSSRPILVELRFSLMLQNLKVDYLTDLRLEYSDPKSQVPEGVTVLYFTRNAN